MESMSLQPARLTTRKRYSLAAVLLVQVAVAVWMISPHKALVMGAISRVMSAPSQPDTFALELAERPPTTKPCQARLENVRNAYMSSFHCRRGSGQCFTKCPGFGIKNKHNKRWLDSGWLEVEHMVPLMRDQYSAQHTFTYVDVGCDKGQEVTYILDQFDKATVVALELRPEVAKVCRSNGNKAIRHPSQQNFMALNIGASMDDRMGKFRSRNDRSTLLLDSSEIGKEIEYSSIDSIWDKYIKPRPLDLLKLDAEGWDGWILVNGTKSLLESKLVKHVIFEYHGTIVTWHGQLKDFTRRLYGLGYACFLITCSYLFPLSPAFWHDRLEYRGTGNVFCGLAGDGSLLSRIHRNYYEGEGFIGTGDGRKVKTDEPPAGKTPEW
jgi:FkbM family methyltransferase